ncbi:hypothetical protein, partial [Burkholderia anthina]|uniref:hypothetical protein n=1 Tax=Burkholderia anthina TaxID=179879 RepID=UPI0033409DAE
MNGIRCGATTVGQATRLIAETRIAHARPLQNHFVEHNKKRRHGRRFLRGEPDGNYSAFFSRRPISDGLRVTVMPHA